MLAWPILTLAYAAALFILSVVRPAKRGTRALATALGAGAAVAASALPARWFAQHVPAVWLPAAFLLVSYWLSAFFFIHPSPRAEAWLLRQDQRLMAWAPIRWAAVRLPASALAVFELAYLCVYPLLPVGAGTLLWLGCAHAIPDYWSAVFAACLPSYAMLLVVQTRPPRALEGVPAASRPSFLRALNLLVLRFGSHQKNTVPSGHAAAAVAVALAAGACSTGAAIGFGIAAVMIAIATVIGRYHYAVDTLLGIGMGMLGWAIVSVW